MNAISNVTLKNVISRRREFNDGLEILPVAMPSAGKYALRAIISSLINSTEKTSVYFPIRKQRSLINDDDGNEIGSDGVEPGRLRV